MTRSGESVLSDDPRFEFAWHVPPSGEPGRPLLIAVHGSDRNWREVRDAFAPIADELEIAVISPHFPPDLTEAGGGAGYKFLREPGIDYQQVLDAMLSALAERYAFDREAIYIYGFSGGGQFVLRYTLLNPEKLRGAVIAAPGSVTLLDRNLPWWVGIADVEEVFGRPVDIEALRRIPIQLLVGADDGETLGVAHGPGTLYHAPHGRHAGENRIERIAALERSLRDAGMTVSLETVPDAAHDFEPIAAAASAALRRMLPARS